MIQKEFGRVREKEGRGCGRVVFVCVCFGFGESGSGDGELVELGEWVGVCGRGNCVCMLGLVVDISGEAGVCACHSGVEKRLLDYTFKASSPLRRCVAGRQGWSPPP